MPSHQTLPVAAQALAVEDATLLEFARKQWIEVIERRGTSYLDSHQQYKARYILHLRNQRKLTDEQIGFVLSEQRPPYSAKQVDELLQRFAGAVPHPA